MARTNLASMSVDALLQLRDDIGKALSQKASQLQDQLSRLGGEVSSTRQGRRSSLKGRKAPIKYRDRSGNTLAGRGAQPVWLREKLKAGAKLARGFCREQDGSFSQGLPQEIQEAPEDQAADQTPSVCAKAIRRGQLRVSFGLGGTCMRIPTIPARDSNLKAATIPIEGGQHWPVGTFMGSQRW